jgi:hypothetical protein
MDHGQASAVFTKTRWQLVAWVIASIAALGLGIHVNQYEGGAIDILFTVAVICMTGALVAFASRRPLFALVFTTALVAIIFAISKAKQESMNMVLHAYDIIFYFRSWSTVSFLIESYRSYAVGLVIGLTAVIAVSMLAYRIDGARLRRSSSAIAAAGFAIVTLVAASARDERQDGSYFFDDRYVSSFFSSLSETFAVIWRGNLVEAASFAPGPTFTVPATCRLATPPPNIILIHQESAVPPSHFPQLAYDRRIDPFFRSYDGKLHKLGVETYAGASWLTEFSVLTGLSSHSFGGMRPFVQTVMAGKLHDTLPQVLDRCGYYNLLVYPMLRNFVSNARFYDKVGIHKILDAKDQNVTRDNERDRFYYANALAEMERNFALSPKPMFVYILTQASHGDYDFTYMPEVSVAGGEPGTDPGVHEYLRRIGMAAMDYDFLKAELSRRFPGRPFLIVNYGDHQPAVTRGLLGSTKYSGILSVDRHPAAFSTYYSVDAVGYQPPALPSLDQVDVPYLGTILLEAARLPLPDSYLERKRLMWRCNGSYHGCIHKADIMTFHRRLMNSGLMDPM